MNKNYSVAIMILIVFAIVGVFLYVVFKSDRYNIANQEENLSNVSVDVANYIESENFDSVISDDVIKDEIVNEIDNNRLAVEKKNIDVEKNNQNSPETGPSILIVLSIIISVTISLIIYKKQKIA